MRTPLNLRRERGWFPENSGRVFCVVLLLLGPAGAPCARAQAQDLINQMRGLKDRYSGWRPPSNGNETRAPRVDPVEEAWARKVAAQNQAEAERVQKQQQLFQSLQAQGHDAFRQRNYATALQYYETLRIEHRNAGIYSPQLEETMLRARAYQAWGGARTAADFRRAYEMRPSFFNEDNLKHLERMEELQRERERDERERPLRAAADRAALAKVTTVIEALAASVGGGQVPDRPVLIGDGKTGRKAADMMFGGLKADPYYRPDDGTTLEHAAVEHGLGFDDYGRLKGEMAAPPPAPRAVAVDIPERVRANPEFQRLPGVVKLREFEAQAEVATRAAVVARARYEEVKAADPAAGELLLLGARAKDAESQAAAAKNMATFQKDEVTRTVSFAAFNVDPPAKTGKPTQP